MENTLNTIRQLDEGINNIEPPTEVLNVLKQQQQKMAKIHNGIREVPSIEECFEKMSEDSRQIIQHFGPEAAALINEYSISLEDALLQVAKTNSELKAALAKAFADIDNYEEANTKFVEDFATVRELVKNENWETLSDVARTLGR